ncbi:MAG: hypothetical protein KIT58_09790, partial [Planctomycetota bacterium]|nr:hypothetical protein [Planctomycetota bacterium]
DGDDVRGTCRFRLDGLYEGALRFDARREGGRWTITRLELPALGLRSTLVDGRWRGAGAILSLAWVRQELGFAFAPGVDRETFETWKRPGRRPELDALSGPTPGDALLTRSCAPRPDSTWRFFRGEAPPSLEHLEAVLEERGRRGLATFVTPGEVSRLRLSAAGADREEVMATAELRAARGAFAVRVDGLMEGEGTFEARYVTPDHLPGGLEGAWVLHALELPGLGWRFEREADHHTWRVVPRSGERGQ